MNPLRFSKGDNWSITVYRLKIKNTTDDQDKESIQFLNGLHKGELSAFYKIKKKVKRILK